MSRVAVACPGRRLRAARLPHSAAAGLVALAFGLVAWTAPAAHAAQRPAGARVASAILYKYTFSRIAWTGADAVIAAADSHGDLYYFWQASGTASWHKQLVAAATSHRAYSKPSPIAQMNGTLYFAAVDGAGDLYAFTKTGTTPWSQVLLGSGGASKYQAPSATTGDANVVISASTTGGDLVTFTHFVYGGTTWTEQTAAAGLFGPSSVTTCCGTEAFITAASGGSLYFWWENLAAPGWNQETVAAAGAGGSYTGGSVAASGN
jgi:hypothetical protein